MDVSPLERWKQDQCFFIAQTIYFLRRNGQDEQANELGLIALRRGALRPVLVAAAFAEPLPVPVPEAP